MQINLNADMGESFGPWPMGDDASLIRVINSANVACGFHAGDPMHMVATVKSAIANGVSIGAHPAFQAAIVTYQVGALQAIAHAQGGAVTHVKPHGAMSNMACADDAMATTIARAVKAIDPHLILLAPACSALARAGEAAGLRVAIEVFADRAYQADGQLVPRSQPHAMVHGAEASAAHVLRMLDAGGLVTHTGAVLPTPIHSICVHGDNPEAVASAAAVRDALRTRGYALVAIDQLLAT
jgi:5-oxoprolinase (ATP-hydrolysing) subunit A